MSDSTDIYLNRGMSFPPGDDAQFIEDMGGTSRTYGGTINQYTALTYNAVYGAVNRISGDIAKLPFHMYEVLPDGGRQIAKSHPTEKVVSMYPQDATGAVRFWKTFFFHALLWSHAYAYIQRNSIGQCIGLQLLPPESTYPNPNYDEYNEYDYFITVINGVQIVLERSDVLDVVGLQYDASNCLDITRLASLNWGSGIAANKYINEFFQNGMQAGGVFTVPPETTIKSEQNLKTKLDRAFSNPSNAFKSKVLPDGVTFNSTQVKPTDAQMIEALTANVKDVARWFNLPPSKLGADDGGVYGSREQDARDYLDSCLSPWMAQLSSQCSVKLLTKDARERGKYEFAHDTSQMIKPEANEYMMYIKTGIEAGLFSPNEGRSMLNLPPREDGDEYYHSNNMQPDDEPEPEPVPVEVPIPEPVAEEVERQFHRDCKRLASNLKRVIKRKIDRFGLEWIDTDSHRATERYVNCVQEAARPFAAITNQNPKVIATDITDDYIDTIFKDVLK